jgi:hypothetical protein
VWDLDLHKVLIWYHIVHLYGLYNIVDIYIYDYIRIYIYTYVCVYLFVYSLDWFKGTSTGIHGFYHQI